MRRKRNQGDVVDGFRDADMSDLTKRLLAYTARAHGPEKASDLVVRAIRESIHGDHTHLYEDCEFFEFLVRVIDHIG